MPPARLTPRLLRALAASHLLNRPLTFCAPPLTLPRLALRSSSSSTRWRTRQSSDTYTRAARTQGLKSRAAFKLLQLDAKHALFAPGQTVVDLGFAPGSWSQVAAEKARGGRVVGIDVIPAQPPAGVSTLQGNFLSGEVQEMMRGFLREGAWAGVGEGGDKDGEGGKVGGKTKGRKDERRRDAEMGRVVDVVLSDMSAPWEPQSGRWLRSVAEPYRRMMNTSGIGVRDHAGSMDLATAALAFAFDMLRAGGHFVVKFYQGAEDKVLERRLRVLFEKVYREKPESSRSESKEAFFVALRRSPDVPRKDVLDEEEDVWKEDEDE
ncbi:23S ribosomal RNA methyltransferase [Trichodelitschia bisporula]|uniref:rRNA methyltransferase 2, mitochondrial n=1 Tax=Trichodelitschia bisporula TaxID=703511 RepID=A0A6G1I2T3_9PEZI|nr:23S ribosomal RNA methyltransferase [Trichodelitschia bisporula]